MTNFTLDIVTLHLDNVLRIDDHFWAAAQLRVGEGNPLPTMIAFRTGCNDWPKPGQLWSVELTDEMTEKGAIIANALIRES